MPNTTGTIFNNPRCVDEGRPALFFPVVRHVEEYGYDWSKFHLDTFLAEHGFQVNEAPVGMGNPSCPWIYQLWQDGICIKNIYGTAEESAQTLAYNAALDLLQQKLQPA